MPRVHLRKPGARKYLDFRQDDLEDALREVSTGNLSIRMAAERYGVPKSTIHRKFHGKNFRKPGRQTIFSEADEKHIVHGILTASKWGFPLNGTEIRNIIKTFLDAKGVKQKPFKNNFPGQEWLVGFLKRHRNVLSLRLSENIKRSRAAVSHTTINEYFDNLELTLANVPPKNVINYDETNMTDDPGQEVVVVRRGTKHPERVVDTSKSSTSVMFAITGNGDLLPPYVVYKAMHTHDNWVNNGPPGTKYNNSKSGWFDSFLFEDWFNKIALEYFRRLPGEKALIGDNLASHITLNVIQACERHNIKFILLPANSTHLTQPLDVAYFRPLKMAWRKSLLEWKKKNRGSLPKSLFPSMLRKALLSLEETSSQNIASGFKACGLIPLDREQVLKRLPKEHDTDNDKDIWSRSFEEQLSNARKHEPLRTRKKKNNVPPGLNLAATRPSEDEPDSDIEVPLSRSQTQEPDNSDEDVSESNEVPEKEKGPESEASDNTIRVNSFVLCKLIYNRGTKKEHLKKYVAQIIDVNDDIYQVSCMRFNERVGCYVFPDVEDILDIEHNQVEKVLPEPVIRRGRYTFKRL